ncbi:ankyrin repeat-containing domain protein, partial [Mycena vulgaris]
QPGTGGWLLEADSFKQWRSGSGKVLWCRGIPGAGKTVLASVIVENLRAHQGSQNTGVAVVYLNHKETDVQSPQSLLAGLWRQLIFKKPISSVVYQLYAKHREQRTRPSLGETDAILRSTLSEYSRVFIIIDALDEYTEELRDTLLRRLSALGPTVNLMLTSRPHINILPFFHHCETLELRANEDDIRGYVDAQILKFSRLAKHLKNCPDLKGEIETKIVQGSDGMFLLAKLHIDSLTAKMTVKAVRAALNNLMGDLDSTYSEVVERINRQSEDEKSLAWLVLSWITNAQRPLRPAELREALAVESAAPFLDPDNLLDIETILAVCAGLVIVDEADNLVRLIHYTTHDYLERIQADEFPHAQTEIASVCITYLSFDVFSSKIYDHTIHLFPDSLLDYCVDYCLTHARGQPESDIKPLILSFLKSCSAWRKFWNWRHSCERIPVEAAPLWIAAVFRLGEICRYLIQEEGTGGLLQEASLQGLVDVVRILVENGASVDTNEGEYDSPLQAASVSGHDEIIGLLLTHGANINLQGTRYGTALELAAFFGHKSSVRLLIDGGANVNAAGGRYGTALYAAAGGAQGDEESIRLLLKHGAAVNGKGGHYGTALRASIYRGADGIARVLLEHGADIHAEQIISANMLQRAISMGHDAIARLLVEYGAPINEKGTVYTALDVAARCGKAEIAHFLISRGAKGTQSHTTLYVAAISKGDHGMFRLLTAHDAQLKAMEDEFITVLEATITAGRNDISRRLIEHSVKVTAMGKQLKGVLYASLSNGYDKSASLLIEHGASALEFALQQSDFGTTRFLIENAKVTWMDQTAVFDALHDGYTSVANLLSVHDAEVDTMEEEFIAMFCAAILEGHNDVIHLLIERFVENKRLEGQLKTLFYAALTEGYAYHLIQCGGRSLYSASGEEDCDGVCFLVEHGADVTVKGTYGRALQAASLAGNKEIVSLLIKHGTDVNAQGFGRYGGALQAASWAGHQDIVSVLIKNGADVNAQSQIGSALQFACSAGREAIVGLLLESGADANVQGGIYGSVLVASSSAGHTEIVSLLIRHGADINTPDEQYGSALQAASLKGHEEIVSLLLERGADVNANNSGKYGSALQAASLKGHQEIVSLLIQHGANVNAKGGRYGSALLVAQHEGIAELLVQHGA